jgi:uncharacterized protein with von Willebrand factor type A (vWA) domain
MSELDTSLFQVFEQLRQQGVPLGVSDYLEAIETIQTGWGLEDIDSFKSLLRLFWTKSREDGEFFDTTFAKLVESRYKLKSLTNESKKPFENSQPANISFDDSLEPNESQPKTEETKTTEGEQSQLIKLKVPGRLEDELLCDEIITEEQQYYQLTPRLIMSRREMAGIWRQLRRPQRIGVPEELDVENTIKNISNTGFLLNPALKPRRRNQARLVLLVDKQGSMTPFEPLIKTIIESILRGGLLGKTKIYYFHDFPQAYLYQRPNLTNGLPLTTALDRQVKGNSVLVISDAGAARGNYDEIRVAETKSFLQTLTIYTYLYAWLNPMPRNRWEKTTAEDIARIVPMFSVNREGLNDAVNILRGHPFPSGVGL